MSKFVAGQEVEWRSQAAGSVVYKRGIIVQVVAPGKKPSRLYSSLYRSNGVQTVRARKTESYVVEDQFGLGSRQFYWPRVSNLRAIKLYRASDATDAESDVSDEYDNFDEE